MFETHRVQTIDWLVHFTWIFTLLSTLPACMSYEIGERLGFGITMVLVMEVAKQTLATLLPICGELLWVDLFVTSSEFVCLISLLETCVVLALSYYTEEHLVPPWITKSFESIIALIRIPQNAQPTSMSPESCLILGAAADGESSAGLIYRQRKASRRSSHPDIAEPTKAGDVLDEEDELNRLILFEHLFFTIDVKAKGFISHEAAAQFLSYAALHIKPSDRKALIESVDHSGSGVIFRWEFVRLCTQALSSVPMGTLEMAQQNFSSAQEMFRVRNRTKWLALAKKIDASTRYYLPPLYMTWVILLFNIEFSDDYEVNPGAPMFEGFGRVHISAGGVLRSLIVPLLIGFVSAAWVFSRNVALKKGFVPTTPFAGPSSRKSDIQKKSFAAFDTSSILPMKNAEEPASPHTTESDGPERDDPQGCATPEPISEMPISETAYRKLATQHDANHHDATLPNRRLFGEAYMDHGDVNEGRVYVGCMNPAARVDGGRVAASDGATPNTSIEQGRRPERAADAPQLEHVLAQLAHLPEQVAILIGCSILDG